MKKPDFSEEIRNAQSATVTYFLIIVDNESQKKNHLNQDNHVFQNRLAVGRILETISRYGKLDSPGKSGRLSVASPGMSIIIVCPGCGKRFKVSDKFAGKIGPC